MDPASHSPSSAPAGAGLVHCDAVPHLVKYFGSIPEERSQFPTIDALQPWAWTAETGRTRLWRVLSTLKEVQRYDGEVNLTPLPIPEIEGRGRSRSLLKLAITVTDMNFDPLLYFIDAGHPFELWGKRVTVRWMSAPAVREVPAPPNVPTASGVVLDGLLGVQILAIETGLGVVAPLTDYRPVAPEAQLSLAIPPGAVDVTIYQNADGPASLEWTWFYGDPGTVPTALPLGQLPFIAGQRRTHTASIVPGASHLAADVAALAARFFTIVWTIRA